MEWQVVVALVLAAALCFFPIGMAWHSHSRDVRSHKSNNARFQNRSDRS